MEIKHKEIIGYDDDRVRMEIIRLKNENQATSTWSRFAKEQELARMKKELRADCWKLVFQIAWAATVCFWIWKAIEGLK